MKAWFIRCLLCIAAFGLCLSHAHAVTRCEDSSGKVTYVDGACPSGSAAVRNVANPATAPVTEQTTAVNRASQEYKDAERMRIAREKQERKQATANAAADKRARVQAKKCQKLAVRVKRAKEDEKSVRPKDAEKKKLKRTRLEEDYAQQCKS